MGCTVYEITTAADFAIFGGKFFMYSHVIATGLCNAMQYATI